MEQPTLPLKVLLVEDSAADVDLLVHTLRHKYAALEHRIAASEMELRQALASFDPEVVLSDYRMPGFSGMDALRICSEVVPATPFIFVSGTIGEATAIDALQHGAYDYVLKDGTQRLPAAIERALDVSRARRERQHIANALQDSERRYRTLVESSNDWIWETDLNGRLVYSNLALRKILGHGPDEVIGRRRSEFLVPGARLPHDPDAADASWQHLDLQFRHRDGSVRMLESTGTALHRDGALVGQCGIDRDVTQVVQQQTRIGTLARLHGMLSELGRAVLRVKTRQGVLDAATEVLVRHGGFVAACVGKVDADGRAQVEACHGDPAVIDALHAGCQTIAADVLGHPGAEHARPGQGFLVPDLATDAALSTPLRESLRASGVAAMALLPLGRPPWAGLAMAAARPQAFDAEERALFDRLADEIDFAIDMIGKNEQLQFLAYHNPVSGLPNRSALQGRLQAALAHGPMVLALVEIQRFDAITESRGRLFADALVKHAGARLSALMPDDGRAAHLDGEMFALTWPSHGAVEAQGARLDRLLHAFAAEPCVVDGHTLHVDLRAGLAIGPEHGQDAEALEHNAAAALAEAERRKLPVHVFGDELRGRASRRLSLDMQLRAALADQQFELYFQPKFVAADQRMVGAEALLRWRHPERGLVPPGDFIPALEDSGLIVPVGHWVMREALRTALDWRRTHPHLRIAVNVSAHEFRQHGFLEECRTLLGPHVRDQPIDIEVTESMLMEDVEHCMGLLEALRGLGCGVSIDDFGTGYSSLNYLTRLPTDQIKIDRSFIAQLTRSPKMLALVTHVIQLAHSLSLEVVAEGVEEEEQARLLRVLRCDQLQGYLLGRPMPAAAFGRELLAVS